jgi:hypothetical protein
MAVENEYFLRRRCSNRNVAVAVAVAVAVLGGTKIRRNHPHDGCLERSHNTAVDSPSRCSSECQSPIAACWD